ncbi:ADP-ribosyltransferase [Actinomadura sp. HBU206391]|uniref:ADP-ribosyltransferase n=1 Tax=Actinomadura sp. HBU206391 TaxID=2731692 RepID=UPI00164F7DDF|nr:ADP-ribosyltransferase [Actinomadura sp. HBU206391]MBC6458639.1 hypothetical protein [Actinomadura sp. HBU206391]
MIGYLTRRGHLSANTDRGEGALSYLVVSLLVAVLVGALLASGLPTDVSARFQAATCQVLRHECPPEGTVPAGSLRGGGGSAPAGGRPDAAGSVEQAGGNCWQWAGWFCAALDGLRLGSWDIVKDTWEGATYVGCLFHLCSHGGFRSDWAGIGALFTTNPLTTLDAIWDGATHEIFADWNDERKVRAVFRAVPSVLGIVFGGKGLTKLNKLGKKKTGPDDPVVVSPDGFGFVEAGIRHFRTDDEGEAYGNKILGHVFPSLPADQQHAGFIYTKAGGSYNNIVRAVDPQAELDMMLGIPGERQELLDAFDGKVPTLQDIYARTALLDKAAAHPLPEGMRAKRGLTSLGITVYKNYDGKDPRSLIGSECTELGYTSTSLGETVVPTTQYPVNYVLHLDIPNGHPGLWMGPRSFYPEQRELLLPRGTSYKITDAVANADGTWNLYATVRPFQPEILDGKRVADGSKAASSGRLEGIRYCV